MFRRCAVVALLLPCACRTQPAEQYGLVATLGTDTTSVEWITRTGRHITGDAVGRSPTVVRRRWEATLDEQGRVVRWSMDTDVPNAEASRRRLHHELEIDGGSVRVVRHAGPDTLDETWQQRQDVVVPWNAFLYGTWELMLQAARTIPDHDPIGQYFFEGWAEGRMGEGRVRRLADGSYAVTSSGLAGTGIARVDSAGRLLAYSGEGTTYKQDVRRVETVPDLDSLTARFAAAEHAAGVPRVLSLRDTVQAVVGGVTLTVDYGRPRARGRTLLGGIIPRGRVWRTGANEATHLTLSAPARIGGVPLDSGTYTLWTLPAEDGVLLIINRQTRQWGTGYGAQHDIARVPMLVESPAAPVDTFTIRTESDGAARARLLMEWGTFRWSVPVTAR